MTTYGDLDDDEKGRCPHGPDLSSCAEAIQTWPVPTKEYTPGIDAEFEQYGGPCTPSVQGGNFPTTKGAIGVGLWGGDHYCGNPIPTVPVSYTHLTLPTIYSV